MFSAETDNSAIGQRFGTALCLAAFLLLTAFATGLVRGMDHKTEWGPDSEQNEIAIALSETVYGLNLGYVGFEPVKAKLAEIWNRGGSGLNDPAVIKNCGDRDLLNEAITAASSLGPQAIGYVGNHTLITAVYDDVGYVDFVKLSFSLFGRRIEAMYHTFFLVLGISAAVFAATLRRSVTAILVLLTGLLAFVVEMNTGIFYEAMPSVTGLRHSSALALIPMWYFVFLLRRRFSWSLLAGVVIQLAILILAMRVRGSASWTVLFIILVGAVAALQEWRSPRSLRSLIQAIARWPLLVLAIGLAGNALYSKAVLHPVYSTDDVIPYHGLWHSAVLGLQYDPSLYSARTTTMMSAGVTGDAIGYYEAIDYLERTHFLPAPAAITDVPIGYLSPWTGAVKFRLHDDVMRGVFFAAVRAHPLAVASVYLYEKPRAIISNLRAIFANTPGWSWLIALVLGVAVIGSVGSRLSASSALKVVGTSAAAAAVSAAPNFWAYPGFHAISDHFLTLLLLAGLMGALLFQAIIRLGSIRRSRPE